MCVVCVCVCVCVHESMQANMYVFVKRMLFLSFSRAMHNNYRCTIGREEGAMEAGSYQ